MGFKQKSKYLTFLLSFLHDSGLVLEPDLPSILPFSNDYHSLFVDLSLRSVCSSDLFDPYDFFETFKQSLTENFDNMFCVDASVSTLGKVGISIISPSLNLNLSEKLPDGIPIYYAEAYAILRALQYSIDHQLKNVCILSDSYAVLHDIKLLNINYSPHPSLISGISNILLHGAITKVQLIWVPGHTQNSPLSPADRLAKWASSATGSFQVIKYSSYEIQVELDKWGIKRWYKEWKDNSSCVYQETFNPAPHPVLFSEIRAKDTVIHRLRLLQKKLNSGMFKIGLHRDGLCGTCGVKQDGFHLVMECKDTEDMRNNLKGRWNPQIDWNFSNIVSDKIIVSMIADYILKKNIEF